MVDAYLKALDNTAKKTIFLLADGTLSSQQVDIETGLEPNVTTALAKNAAGDHENAETRKHELDLARNAARGPIWVEVAKWVLIGAGWFLAAGFGIKVFSSGG